MGLSQRNLEKLILWKYLTFENGLLLFIMLSPKYLLALYFIYHCNKSVIVKLNINEITLKIFIILNISIVKVR